MKTVVGANFGEFYQHPLAMPAGAVEANVYPADCQEIRYACYSPFPKHLHREDVVIDPVNVCETDVCIGMEITEQLEYISGELYVKRYLLRKFLIRNADGFGKVNVIANLPVQPIDKCILGSGLLACMVLDKYVESEPVRRQLGAFARMGVFINKSIFNAWLEEACKLLLPFYELLKAEVLASNYIHADETSIKVLSRGKKTITHKGYFSVYQSKLARLVFFEYQPGIAQRVAMEVLKDYQGYLQVEDSQVYKNITKKPGVTLLCCMAHVRRQFENSLDFNNELATIALSWFRKLYAIEQYCKEEGLNDEEICGIRQKEAVPILNTMAAWIKDELYTKKSVSPLSPIGKAMTYAMMRWDYLLVYTTNGMLDIDNNPVDPSISRVALCRKNHTFAGSQKSAQHAAMLHSFMETCRMNGIDSRTWLKDVLCQVHITPKEYRYLLLPHNWEPRL